jgi:hypothetical protein
MIREVTLEVEITIVEIIGIRIEAEVGLIEIGPPGDPQGNLQEEIILQGEPLKTEEEKNLEDLLNQPKRGFWKREGRWKNHPPDKRLRK